MPLLLIQSLFWIGAGLALLHFVVAGGFFFRLWTARRSLPADADCPRAMVILCLRGADPSLRRCLTNLLNQNYPQFQVVIVVDDERDDAWRSAHEIVSASGAANVEIESLRRRPTTCGLKCAALAQAWSHLDEGYDVVATIDADVVPHSTWLRELVAPLVADKRIGATCGNRWYRPQPVSWGAAVRYLWNIGAVVPMYWHGIAWGGSLCVRAAVLRQTDYRERVLHALCEDVMLQGVLRRAGLKLHFNPNLMIVNREDTTLRGFFHWMRRQSLIMRLYHRDAPVILGHGVLSGLFFFATPVVLLTAAVRGDLITLANVGFGFALFLASLYVPIPFLEAAVRRIVRRRDETVSPYAWPEIARIFAALPLTQACYAAAVATLLRARQIEWRGIHYRIEGPLKVTRLNDGAYQAVDDAELNRSL
jgi:cellulose synthase/poly-beta-1,6-N-acetylglucosamine synthase-like glycosyltransferase